MSIEKRPTCVTVIGWFWIIVGGLMCVSALMGLFVSVMTGQLLEANSKGQENMRAIFKFFPILLPFQLGIGVLGIISGVKFLRLKRWSRSALEVLTWVSLISIIAFSIHWISTWGYMSSGHEPPGFAAMGLVMGIVVTAMHGVPLGIILKYLRGNKVKDAMIGYTESTDRQAYSEYACQQDRKMSCVSRKIAVGRLLSILSLASTGLGIQQYIWLMYYAHRQIHSVLTLIFGIIAVGTGIVAAVIFTTQDKELAKTKVAQLFTAFTIIGIIAGGFCVLMAFV